MIPSVDEPANNDGGVNVPVAPVGRPLTLRVVLPGAFEAGVTVAVNDVEPPGTIVCEGGPTESERDGLTISVTDAVRVDPPLVPDIVRE